MDSPRILVAMRTEASAANMKPILLEAGCTVVDYANDGNECLRKITALKPDVTVLEYEIPLMDGLEVSRIALQNKSSDILLLVSPEHESNVFELRHELGFTYHVKPINKVAFMYTVELMTKNLNRIRQLEKEIEELRSSMDARKEIERAKGLLMKHLNITEPEAYKRMQKQSMDKGISMKEIAKAIILTYDL